MAIKKNRVPVRSQLPEERITNFDEVCFGYNASEAIQEAERCIQCKNPRCVQAVSYTHLTLPTIYSV